VSTRIRNIIPNPFTETDMREMYHVRGMSQRDMAIEASFLLGYPVNQGSVSVWMKKSSINARTNSQALQLCAITKPVYVSNRLEHIKQIRKLRKVMRNGVQ